MIAAAVGRPPVLQRLLDSAPIRTLGSFSYSLYLIHLPIVMVVSRKIAKPHTGNGLPEFLVTLLVGVAMSLSCAWLFAKAFEAPFQKYRSWRELRAGLRSRRVTATGESAPWPLPRTGPGAFPGPADDQRRKSESPVDGAE
jgi:peptidoglycan/LPS O-acetylase OafA/YrhL